MRLVGKCLHVGVLDGETYLEPIEGTAQGSSLSPLLGNVYLHHVLDVWFEREVRPQLSGRAALVRYGGRLRALFRTRGRRRADVEHARGAVQEFGLTLHPKKTRRFPFQPPKDGGGKGSATFDFLGFTLYWRRTRYGTWRMGCKTRSARLTRSINAAVEWCRSHRHDPIETQRKALSRKLTGHYNYFGVNGNIASLQRLFAAATRAWKKWLDRRSQRARMNWKRFRQLLAAHPLPKPTIRVRIWG